MSLAIDQWMDSISGDGWLWYVKYLSGNDTCLTQAHQAGPYFPRAVAFSIAPSINDPERENPRAVVRALIDSHRAEATASMIWYNNKLRNGTRNEVRFTGWGGCQSPILNADHTGSLSVWAFHRSGNQDADLCRIWVCDTFHGETIEEDEVLARVGPVEPGAGIVYQPSLPIQPSLVPIAKDSPCRLRAEEIPEPWFNDFPSAAEIVADAIGRVVTARMDPPDKRLIRRRNCEFELFRSVEELVVMPRIAEGFASVDLFVDFANSVTNRRKSRSGRSLELHAAAIFEEEGLPFSHGEESEHGKLPDFLFPSAEAYRDLSHPVDRLQMLGVKTTCKDRWRQVIDEAERLPEKYLLTLQEGISVPQFTQIRNAGITLVLPRELHGKFHESVRSELVSLERFIALTRAKCG